MRYLLKLNTTRIISHAAYVIVGKDDLDLFPIVLVFFCIERLIQDAFNSPSYIAVSINYFSHERFSLYVFQRILL